MKKLIYSKGKNYFGYDKDLQSLGYYTKYSEELNHFIGGYDDWKWEYHHAGFDIVSNRILEVVKEYYDEVKDHFDDDVEELDDNNQVNNFASHDSNEFINGGVCFWVTGHSMGAGVANLVAASLISSEAIQDIRALEGNSDNIYCYTFAAPNTFYKTDNRYIRDSHAIPGKNVTGDYREPHSVRYRCIFNIVNDDDFVPKLPMEECEWTKYGRVANKIIEKYVNINLKKLVGPIQRGNYRDYIINDYKSNKLAIDGVMLAFNGMYDNKSNMRRETYSYDNKVGRAEIKYKAEDKFVEEILFKSEYTNPYQKYVFNNGYIQNQMPAYLMLSIANSMHTYIKVRDKDTGEIYYRKQLKNKKYLIKDDVPENQYTLLITKFGFNSWGAKWSLIGASAFNTMEYPHYLESYYSLTKELSIVDFK